MLVEYLNDNAKKNGSRDDFRFLFSSLGFTSIINIIKKEQNKQTMTSLEIAELTGKQHKNVMQAIRKMEPAWEKVNGRKFALVEYRDKKGELRPCYSLTKTECLYIATKFNDEARAKLYDSDAYEVLSYRANVIAWLKGMVLYVAHGYKWSKEIADFVRWSEKYNLWCKMLYFGEQLEKELREEVEIQRQSGPKNLLDLLPDEFTKDQYQQMRMSQGKSGDGESTLRTWQTKGYIIFDDVSNRYCKTEEYLRRGSV